MSLLLTVNKSLNIESGEERKVYLLLAQSFFLGIFFATYEISAFTLFQSAFSQDDLYESFMVSGIAGVILSLIYSQLQSTLSFAKLANINLTFIVILMAVMWGMTRFSDHTAVIFLAFIMMGPLNAIGQLGFWGMAGRLFNLRQGKRLFGLVDSGQTFGMIVISFLVPFLLMFFSNIGDLMLVSSVSAFGALIFQFLLVNRFKKDLEEDEEIDIDEPVEKKGMSILDVIKDKYLSKLALFVVFSMLGAFLIYSSFFDVTKSNYPGDNERAIFLGMFLAVVMIFSFIIKVFLFGKLTNMYGIKVSLLLTPVVVGVIVLLAAVVGTAFGYTPEMENFTLFFLMICMARLFSHSLSMSIEGPVTKILYQPIEKAKRYDAQSKIDGTVNEFSSVVSGVILLGLSKLTFFKSVHISYIVVAVILAWIYIIVKLYKGYRETLQETLSNSEGEIVEKQKYEDLYKELNSLQVDKVMFSLQLLTKVEPLKIEEQLKKLINHNSPNIRERVLELVDKYKVYEAIGLIRKRIDEEKDPKVEAKLYQVLETLYLNQEESLTYDYLELLSKSRSADKRKYAAKLITKETTRDNLMLLVTLLRDLDAEVRIAAIITSSKTQSPLLWPYLLDNLNNQHYRPYAEKAIMSIGQPVLTELNESYNRSDVSVDVQRSIIKLIGGIGGGKAQGFLLEKLAHAEPHVLKAILNSLNQTGFQAKGVEIARITASIEQTVKNIIWNLASIDELGDGFPLLVEALDLENEEKTEHVFLLLCLIYDSSSIAKIKENIDLGSVESIGYAIEMLDLFLAEGLKSYLFPLFEDSSVVDKLKQLSVHYFRPKLTIEQVLLALMSRDFNYTNAWTKVMAVHYFEKRKNKAIPDELAACIFNPDNLINELAALKIYELDQEKYYSLSKRIPPKRKREFDRLITGSKENQKGLVFKKVTFVKKIFEKDKLPIELLITLSKLAERIFYKENNQIITKTSLSNDVYILVQGEVVLKVRGESKLSITTPGLISDAFVLDSDGGDTHMEVQANSLLYKIKFEEISSLLNQYPELITLLIKQLDVRLNSITELEV
ncbi:MFS transporter [Cyclobacteriaceae bacterium]|nr:MFS transporter [Cyclobacteriaceae bacterium]